MTQTPTTLWMPDDTLDEFEGRVRTIMERYDEQWWLDYPRHAVAVLRQHAHLDEPGDELNTEQFEQYLDSCQANSLYAIALHGATREAIEELQNEGIDQHFSIEHDADFDRAHLRAHYDGPREGEFAWVQVGNTYLAPLLGWAGEQQLFPDPTRWRDQIVEHIVAAEKHRRDELHIELRCDPNYAPPIKRVNRTRRPKTQTV